MKAGEALSDPKVKGTTEGQVVTGMRKVVSVTWGLLHLSSTLMALF